jgi:hypothetical protein
VSARRSSARQPHHPLKILLHRFKAVVKRNLPACKKALKIELWHSCEKRRLAKSQVLRWNSASASSVFNLASVNLVDGEGHLSA